LEHNVFDKIPTEKSNGMKSDNWCNPRTWELTIKKLFSVDIVFTGTVNLDKLRIFLTPQIKKDDLQW